MIKNGKKLKDLNSKQNFLANENKKNLYSLVKLKQF